MKNHRSTITSVLLLASLLMTFAQTATAKSPFKGLLDPDGQSASLTETFANGRWTLVMIWSTDCIPCTRQKPLVSKFYNKHKTDTANVLGIAIDGRANVGVVKAYLDHHQPNFPNYVANRSELALALRRFGVTENFPTPLYILFDRTGKESNISHAPFSISAVEAAILKRES